MNILNGLYFPGTGPNKELFCSLLCLLDKVGFYQIVAPDAAGDNEVSLYWEGQVVLPLGEERDRFLATIWDIKTHAADFYGSYLSALSAESLVDRDEASVWQLVASLHGQNKKTEQDPALTEKIWQARLLLHLAGILAEEQADLTKNIVDLNRAEQAVFDALKGVHDDLADCAEVLPTAGLELGSGQSAGNIKHLLKAWGTLFVMDPAKHALLVTDNEDGAAILFDSWAELSGERPQLLAELDLPVVGSVAAMEASRTELAEARTALVNSLLDTLADNGVAADPAKLKAAVELWQGQIGAIAGARCRLDIYLLASHPLQDAWSRISNMAATNDNKGSQPSLVAVLKSMR